MKKTILILGIIAVFFASCKRDEMLEEGDKWHNGHAAVDLGLPSGLYWATCNIGASSPEEYGDYYAWGETSVKKYYSEENSETYMSRMNDISGDAQYDAARAIWGGQWRMPTKYEMQELLNLCSWEETTFNGIEGYQVTGPNGNSIFLPVAGAKEDDYIYNKGYASYWTSTPHKGDTGNEEYNIGCAYGYYSDQDDLYTFSKCTGLTIRPVFGGNEKPIGIDAVSRYVENLTSTTARFSVRVLQEETSTIETYGACWSTDTKPTMDDYHYTFYEYYDHDNDGSCLDEVYLENLQPNTIYYIRAFATHGDAVVYGEIMSFTTLDEEPETPNVPEEPEIIFANQSFTVNGVTFTMIAVEGGTFQMGATSEQGIDADDDEKPVHSITLSDYYIGETEVTQELWEAVMGSNPSYFKGNMKPVEIVSWNDCQTFIKKLNQFTGKNFRLPTEAEWEYAARGGNKSKGYKYSGSNTINDVAWYEDNSGDKTHDVKTKQANELGIYDMSGNVWEWCQDWYGSNYYSNSPSTNPTGPTSGSPRVLRGGSWYYDARCCRVSHRYGSNPDGRGSNFGFRLILQELQ